MTDGAPGPLGLSYGRATVQVLRARLYDFEVQKRAREVDEQRSALVSSADRSERIRTYNFPQVRPETYEAK